MTVREWLTVGIFLLTLIMAVVAFLLKRFIGTVDELKVAVYGKDGLFALVAQCVRREVHDVANAELAAQMDRMRLEGMQREGRILDALEDRQDKVLKALEKQGDRQSQQSDMLRSDLSKLHDRVDRMKDTQPRRS